MGQGCKGIHRGISPDSPLMCLYNQNQDKRNPPRLWVVAVERGPARLPGVGVGTEIEDLRGCLH